MRHGLSDQIVQRTHFTEALRLNGELPHNLIDLLAERNRLIVLQNGRSPYVVILGVPHQAASGVRQICDHRLDRNGNLLPRKADENSALYALVIFSALVQLGISCKLIIMAHSTTHDPNKHAGSPYCQEIFAEPANLLFECHGSRMDRQLSLELSAGWNRVVDQLVFGRALATALDFKYSLGVQRESGKNDALIFRAGGKVSEGHLQLPALKTYSLIEADRRGLPALHLEAKPVFRKPLDQYSRITPEAQTLGRSIAQVIAG